LLQLTDDVLIAVGQRQRDQAPFDVCPGTRQLLYLDAFTGKDRNLSEEQHLVWKTVARSKRGIADRPLLSCIDRVEKNPVASRFAWGPIFFDSPSHPLKVGSKSRKRLAVFLGYERQDSRPTQVARFILDRQLTPRVAVEVLPAQCRSRRVSLVFYDVQVQT